MSDNNEEVKVEENTIETTATTITVPIPESENDSSVEEVENTINESAAEEQFSIKPTLSPDSEQVKKVAEEQKAYLLERAKESNINLDEIEYDEDGFTPKITDEMLEVFSIYSYNLFDKEFFQIYIDQAKMIIEQYRDFKNTVEKGLTDEDDMEYYSGLAKSYEEARLIMALVQVEYSKIMKDFNENKIFENQSKAVTLSLLRDFFVNEFKLTDSWIKPIGKDPKKLNAVLNENIIKLENDIREKMFVAPIFYEYARKMFIMSKAVVTNDPFSTPFLDEHFEKLIYGLGAYIKYSGKTHDIDLKTIITRDMNNMNFVKAILTTMFIENDDLFIKTTTVTDKSIETLKTKLNPKGVYIEELKALYSKFNTLYKKFEDFNFILSLFNKCETSLKQDSIFKELNISLDESYENFIMKFSGHLPDITGTSIVKWGKYYSYLKKYEFYHSVKLIMELFVSDKDANYRTQERTLIIDCISSYLVEYLNMIYGQMLSDIDVFVKENVYSKPMRDTIFAMLMNNILLQHELGFKSDFDPEVDISGDNLYNLAEKVFGDQYKYVIIDKTRDVLLKDVNLKETRKMYFNIISELMDMMIYDYDSREKSMDMTSYDYDSRLKSNLGKKRSKRNKRSSRRR